MSIDIMRNSYLRLLLCFIYISETVLQITLVMFKIWSKKSKKQGLAFTKLVWQGDAVYYFLRLCSCL